MRLLQNIPLRTKFLLLVGVFAVTLAVALGVSAMLTRDRMMADRIDKLKGMVEITSSMAGVLEAEVTAGHISRDQALDRFRALIHAMRFGADDYLFAYTLDGTVVANGAAPSMQGQNRIGLTDANGRTPVKDLLAVAARYGEGTTEYLLTRIAGGPPVPKRTFVKSFPAWQIVIGTGVYTDDIDAEFRTDLMHTGVLLLGALLASAILAGLLASDITASMRILRVRLERLAAGDHESRVEQTLRRDEAGAMARSLEVVREAAAHADLRRHEQERIRHQAEAEHTAGVARLADELEASVGQVVAGVTQQAAALQGAAAALADQAALAGSGVMTAAEGAGTASGNVQAVAAAAEQLSGSINEIARQVSESARIAGVAATQVRMTDAVVAELNQAAAQIGAVVALIRQIAGQTNLLALNATIEAARAGEAGRGFAVVAGEVKTLAAQTGRATEEIGGQIALIQAATERAVTAIGGIGETITQMNGLSTAIAAAVEQQGNATREIAGSVARAAEATGAVSASVDGLRGVANTVQGTSGTLLGAAGTLSDQARGLNQRIGAFLGAMRMRPAA